ncbi:MAG: 3-phosphoshikimate 1-carboxyvinyltransferase [Candidatus Thermoplasmatota archaeon]
MKPHAVEVRPGRIDGTVTAPPSKSQTHRAFLLAAQSVVPCTVQSPLLADDTRATLSCLLALGARIHLDPDRPETVQFLPASLRAPTQALDCRNSGTTLRILSATAARLGQPVTLTGDDSLRERPNGALHDALRARGATVESRDGKAPVTVRGPLRPGSVRLPAGSSSQYASALLLSLPMLAGPSILDVEAPVASAPYLEVTLDTARAFGLAIQRSADRFAMPGGSLPRADAFTVEGDWSAAAFPLAAAAVTGGSVTVQGLRADSMQGDRAILGHLQSFGASLGPGDSLRGGPLHSPGVIDVSQTPDLFPALVAVAACARGTTTFTGGANLRHKESDRIAAMADGLSRLGADVRETPDGLVVAGGQPLRGATLASHGDHRVHMALCVAALAAQGPSTLDDPAAAAVSYPGFHADLAALGADVRLLQGNRTVVSA